MFKKINTSILIPLVGIIGIFLLTGGDMAHADTITESTTGRMAADTIIQTINLLINLLTIIVTPAVIMAGWLLSPDWTSGDLFGLRPIMHQLWIMISNITYFVYAILLIFIALATIFNSEHYGYKALLPRLALGIILVPMTWWFVQFTISLATIITASVINIPQETMMRIDKEKCTKTECWQNKPLIPTNITFYNAGSSGATQAQVKTAQDATEKSISGDGKCATPGSCLTIEQFLAKGSGTYGSMLIYAYGVFHIGNIKELPTGGLDMISTGIQILHQGLIGVILFLIFGILVLALVIMLLMRAIKLWFYAIFSPLFTLKYVLGDAFKGADKDDSLNITEFIGLAFVPAVVGLCLSFGLMIIGAIQSPNAGTTTGPECTKEKLEMKGENGGCTILGLFGNNNNKVVRRITGDAPNQKTLNEIHIAGITINMEGNIVSGDKEIEKEAAAAASTMSVFSTTGGIFGTIFIDIIALVFLWVSFMAAKGVSKAAGAAMEPFENMGKQIGKLGAGAYKYVPIPGTGGMSVNSMEKVPGMVQGGFEMRADQKFKEETRVGQMLTKWNKAASAEDVGKLKQAVNQGTPNTAVKDTIDVAKNYKNNGNGQQLYHDHDNQESLQKFAQRIKNNEITSNLLVANGIKPLIAAKIIEAANDGIFDEDQIRRVSAWLAGNDKEGLLKKDAEDWLKKPSSSEGNNNTPPSSTQVNININGASHPINIGADGNLADIDTVAKDVKITGKITEEAFKNQLMGARIEESVINQIIQRLKTENNQFFKQP